MASSAANFVKVCLSRNDNLLLQDKLMRSRTSSAVSSKPATSPYGPTFKHGKTSAKSFFVAFRIYVKLGGDGRIDLQTQQCICLEALLRHPYRI